MNLRLLREYVKPGCKVYLKGDLGNYYQSYVPCYVHTLRISNMSTSIMPDIKFDLMFVSDPDALAPPDHDRLATDVSIDRIYVTCNNDLIPLEKYISSIGEVYLVHGRGCGKGLATIAAAAALNMTYGFEPDYFDSKRIIFSGNCTIVIWKDGTKTIARCNKWDDFSPEAGIAICFMKHVLGDSKAKKILRNGNKIFESEVEG